ncbi:MAG: hypothetical protein MJ153_06245 [Clostridia bacterium]|nr:hypothetical protein [Clostridia bacterium]
MICKKMASLLMTTVLLLSCFTACGNSSKDKVKTNQIVKVAEDEPWFSTTRTKNDFGLLDVKFEPLDVRVTAPEAVGDKLVYLIRGTKDYSPEEYMNELGDDVELVEETQTMDYRAYHYWRECFLLAAYDFEGNLLWSSDFKSLIDEDNWVFTDTSLIKTNDELKLCLEDYTHSIRNVYDIDLSDGKLSESEQDGNESGSKYDYSLGNQPKELSIGDKTVNIYSKMGDGSFPEELNAEVISSDGKSRVINLLEYVDIDVFILNKVLKKNNSEIMLVLASFDDEGNYIFKPVTVNVDNMTVEEYVLSEDLKTFEDSFDSIFELDGKIYCNSPYGLYSVDWDAGTKEEIISFDQCNSNITELENATPIMVSDDRNELIFSCINTQNSACEAEIYRFTREEKNPNAGKTVLTVAGLTQIDASTAENIFQFNQSNSEYMIRYTDKYQTKNDDVMELSNLLIQDWSEGIGPDILINSAEYTQFNSDVYLVDLTQYMTDLNSEEYYTNIVDAVKTGDALYQFPLTLNLNCFYGYEEIADNGSGFTFEEYEAIIDEYCDGLNPMLLDFGRTGVFAEFVTNMQTPLIDNGKINLRSDEFKAICEYCASLPAPSSEEDDVGFNAFSVGAGKLNRYNNDYMSFALNDKISLYALPSYNGKAVAATITSSLAISEACANPDAAWDFIKLSIGCENSYDYINGYKSDGNIAIYSSSFKFSMSRSKTEALLSSFQAECNSTVRSFYYSTNENDLVKFNLPRYYIEEEDIQGLLDIIEKVNVVSSCDTDIIPVLAEEFEAYFSGQKSLDEVISISEDRCQTIIDERS